MNAGVRHGVGAGWIRKFNQSVKFLFGFINVNMIDFFIFPNFLPFAFNGAEVVTVFQLPLFLPFFKSFFAIITRIAAHRFSPVFHFIKNIGFKLSQH